MEIRIREINEGQSVHLTDVASVDDIDKVLIALTRWGVYAGGDVTYERDAQFVIEDGRAYFEIIVGLEA